MNATRKLNTIKSIVEELKEAVEIGDNVQGLVDDLYSFLQLDINWNPDEIKYLKKIDYKISKNPGYATRTFRGIPVTFEKLDWNSYNLTIGNGRSRFRGDTDGLSSASTKSEDFLVAWEDYKDEKGVF